MSGFLLKRRKLELGLSNIDLINRINERKFPYKDGVLHVNESEMSVAISDKGTMPKHQAILEAADVIISEMEIKKEAHKYEMSKMRNGN